MGKGHSQILYKGRLRQVLAWGLQLPRNGSGQGHVTHGLNLGSPITSLKSVKQFISNFGC